MTDNDELVERLQRHGKKCVEYGFSGYDNMRHGKESLKNCLREAADAFACAAAIAAMGEGDSPA